MSNVWFPTSACRSWHIAFFHPLACGLRSAALYVRGSLSLFGCDPSIGSVSASSSDVATIPCRCKAFRRRQITPFFVSLAHNCLVGSKACLAAGSNRNVVMTICQIMKSVLQFCRHIDFRLAAHRANSLYDENKCSSAQQLIEPIRCMTGI